MKIPCEHQCHTKYGSGLRAGHERPRRSPKSKIYFRACYTWFIVDFARRIQKSRPFRNLTPYTSITEKGQVNLGSHKVKFSNSFFPKMKKNVFFWTSQISGFDKCHFYFCDSVIEILKIAVWTSDVINGYGFCAICLPKIETSNWNVACQMTRHGSTTCCMFFAISVSFGFGKSQLKITFVLLFW